MQILYVLTFISAIGVGVDAPAVGMNCHDALAQLKSAKLEIAEISELVSADTYLYTMHDEKGLKVALAECKLQQNK